VLKRISGRREEDLPFVHKAVDERIKGRVGHGEQVEGQVDVLHVSSTCFHRSQRNEKEVEVIGKPTEGKYEGQAEQQRNCLLLGSHRFSLVAGADLADRLGPQHRKHSSVRDEHGQQRNGVGDQEEDDIVSGWLSW
jgi:hypothetical protein